MTTTPQTEALRLADEALVEYQCGALSVWTGHKMIDVLRRLDAENQQLKTSLALVQQHHATAWNRGHQVGLMAGESAVKQATDAVKADAWGNTQLTNALMQAEAERDQLRAQLAKAVAEEREACALECESRQANGNRTHTHPDECAAAIRARSNT